MIHPARLRRLATVALLMVLLAGAAFAQNKDEVLLSFTGLVKTVTGKQIVIEPDPDNSMTFVRSRRTKIVQGGKPANESALKPGASVTVDCVTRLNGDLEAITVTLIDLDQSPNK